MLSRGRGGFHTRTAVSWNTRPHHTDKNVSLFFLIYKKIQNGAVAKSYTVWLTASSYMRKYLRIGSPSSYMTLQLLHSEFPHIFSFLSVQTESLILPEGDKLLLESLGLHDLVVSGLGNLCQLQFQPPLLVLDLQLTAMFTAPKI